MNAWGVNWLNGIGSQRVTATLKGLLMCLDWTTDGLLCINRTCGYFKIGWNEKGNFFVTIWMEPSLLILLLNTALYTCGWMGGIDGQAERSIRELTWEKRIYIFMVKECAHRAAVGFAVLAAHSALDREYSWVLDCIYWWGFFEYVGLVVLYCCWYKINTSIFIGWF